jgi:hypothetical protein
LCTPGVVFFCTGSQCSSRVLCQFCQANAGIFVHVQKDALSASFIVTGWAVRWKSPGIYWAGRVWFLCESTDVFCISLGNSCQINRCSSKRCLCRLWGVSIISVSCRVMLLYWDWVW